MREQRKRKEPEDGVHERADSNAGLSPLPVSWDEPATPAPSPQDRGKRAAKVSGDKVYLGVRVKMPVKDLLRNIRLSQGWEPKDLQDKLGDKKRVKTRTGRQTSKRKRPTKSLEELAIIVEVLEEDLKSSSRNCSPPQMLSPSVSPEQLMETNGYSSDDPDEIIPSPQPCVTFSPPACHQQAPVPLSPGYTRTSFRTSSVDLGCGGNMGRDGETGDRWFGPQSHRWNWNSSAFFRAQLLREERHLGAISDAALLATDSHGRTALHKVVWGGKRPLAYAIAKRMLALDSLDVKDSDGMTALLLAAAHNHHLIVEDLISLGASVNERNNSGKSCLHLSAERGYVRVLEVLKHRMMDGLHVDVEATDHSGMSVLQCASVALKATLHELETSMSPGHTRLHELRKMQIMESLECLLPMVSYVHGMGSWSLQS